MQEPYGVLCYDYCGCDGVNDAGQCTGVEPACRNCWEGTSGTYEVYYGLKSRAENPPKGDKGNPLNMFTDKPWSDFGH